MCSCGPGERAGHGAAVHGYRQRKHRRAASGHRAAKRDRKLHYHASKWACVAHGGPCVLHTGGYTAVYLMSLMVLDGWEWMHFIACRACCTALYGSHMCIAGGNTAAMVGWAVATLAANKSATCICAAAHQACTGSIIWPAQAHVVMRCRSSLAPSLSLRAWLRLHHGGGTAGAGHYASAAQSHEGQGMRRCSTNPLKPCMGKG